MPDCAVCLICPRQIGIATGSSADGLYATAPGTTLVVDGKSTSVKYDSLSPLPILFTKPGISSFLHYAKKFLAWHGASDSRTYNHNLTRKQKQKLFLHEFCTHEGFKNLNAWIHQGKFPGVDPTLAVEPDPMCASCCFGKARRLTHKTHTGHISTNHTRPGQGVSSDGLESGTPGRPFTTRGSPSNHRYNYVSLWVDHMSTFVHVTFHSSKAATELGKSKTEFEQFAARFNVKVENIRADNGVYSVQLFCDKCMKQQQDLTFCAVGAHWQNGIAEWFIGTITQRARTILLHAMAKWPSTIHEDMWPFALCHAVNFHNSSFHKDSVLTPYEAFTGQESPWSLHDFRIFGSPVYVLAKEFQDGKSLSKWCSRAWQGVYVGNSSCHASAIPLTYNPQTMHISPQFHVVYDEYFLTVSDKPTMNIEDYLEKLGQSTARWLYKDPFTEDPHLFESYWDAASPPQTTRKCKARSSPNLPLRGSTESDQVSAQASMASTIPPETPSETPHPTKTSSSSCDEQHHVPASCDGTIHVESSSCEGEHINLSSLCDASNPIGLHAADCESTASAIFSIAPVRRPTSERP
jgi:hypothetical protein